MPAVEPGDALGLLFRRNAGLVECRVAGVLELGFGEAFVVVYCAIADKLYLGDAGNGLEIWVENGLLGAFSLVVPVSIAL